MPGPGHPGSPPDNRHEPKNSGKWRPRWENPEESCGPLITSLPDGKNVWMAVGRAADEWQHKLSPKVRTLLERTDDFYGLGVSVFMYMVGREKSTSSPKIIFCSSDLSARKAVRKAVQESGILAPYPAIGLGDSSSPLAREDSGLGQQTPSKASVPGQESHPTHPRRITNVPDEPSGPDTQAPHALHRPSMDEGSPSHQQATALGQHMERLSISSDRPSSPSFDSSNYQGTALDSLDSISRSSLWTPATSVNSLCGVTPREENSAGGSTPLAENTCCDPLESADDFESCSESDDTEDSHDVGSLDPVVARELSHILRRLVDQFDLTRQGFTVRNSEGARGEDHPGHHPSPSSSGTQQRDSRVSRVARGKRPLTGNDDDGTSAVASKKPRSGHRSNKVFACPYWKKDSLAYSRCYKFELKEVKNVKEHLRRVHKKPIRCPRCQREFRTRASCDEHGRGADQCPLNTIIDDEGINEEQINELRKKGPTSLTQEQRWFVTWDIVFGPLVPKPASPYIPDGLSEEMSAFREFYQRDGPTIILDHMRTSRDWSLEDEERFRHAEWQSILAEALNDIQRRWLIRQPQPRTERSNSQATIQAIVESPGAGPATDGGLNLSPSPPGGGDAVNFVTATPQTVESDGLSFAGDPSAAGRYDYEGNWQYFPGAWQNHDTRPNG